MATGTRPTRPALRERWDRRRGEVVAGAARVFAERGYAETSVAELAEELGLATGAIYHYFRGKEELLIAICDELTEPLLDAARRAAGGRAEPERRLRALIRLWVAHVAEHRHHLLVFTQVRHVIDHGEEWRSVRDARKELRAARRPRRSPPPTPPIPTSGGWRCSAWSTTCRSGTGRAAGSPPSRSPTAGSR